MPAPRIELKTQIFSSSRHDRCMGKLYFGAQPAPAIALVSSLKQLE
jgi:hypothetical protein